jgi:adenosine deaminase
MIPMARLTAVMVTLGLCSLDASAQATAEARAARSYDAALAAGPPALHAFLDQFPKGADLHVHLEGAVYAETYIQNAAQDGLCIDPTALKFEKPPCTAPLVAASVLSGALTPAQQQLYDHLVDSFSMRGYVPTPGVSGHDQFFAAFGRFFAGVSRTHVGEWVDEVAARASAQNQQYLELMETPPFEHGATIALKGFLDSSQKAAAQWELERRFRAFELRY